MKKDSVRGPLIGLATVMPIALLISNANPLAAFAAGTAPVPLAGATVGTFYSSPLPAPPADFTGVSVNGGSPVSFASLSSNPNDESGSVSEGNTVVGEVYSLDKELGYNVEYPSGTFPQGVTENVYEADGIYYSSGYGILFGHPVSAETLAWSGPENEAELVVSNAPSFMASSIPVSLSSGQSEPLGDEVAGGTSPLTWGVGSVTAANGTTPINMSTAVGTVYSGTSSTSAGSTIGYVYGVDGQTPGSAYNVYASALSFTGVTGSVYYLGEGIYFSQSGQLWNETGVLGTGTLSFVPSVMDANGVVAANSATVTVQGMVQEPTNVVTGNSTNTGPTSASSTAITAVGNGTTSFSSTVNSSAFTLALTSSEISSDGGTLDAVSGSTSVAVTVPQGAFPSGESVSVNSAPIATVQAGAPTGQTAVAAFGVHFSGATPALPVQIQIKNPSIPASALIYKVLANGQWLPVPATVKNGVLTLSITSDPDFVIVNPNLTQNQRQILWNGQQDQVSNGIVAKDPVHGNLTTYLPIWYVMQVLKSEGLTSSWNGKVWDISTTGSSFTPNLSTATTGIGTDQIEINGQVVQDAYGMVAKDPAHGNMTTYMPIYWVFRALSFVGIESSWNGTSWGMTYSASALGQPTTAGTPVN